MVFFQWVLFFALLGLGVPVLVFVCQIALALLRKSPDPQALVGTENNGFTWTVLIPAHNEEGVVADTLRPLLAEGTAFSGRVLVVADNCTDQTAQICRAMGAVVVERTSASERGKGFALQHGLNHLASNPPDVVIVLDADCTVSASGLQVLASECRRAGSPVQSAYLMHAKETAPPLAKISEFAWLVKTWIRPLGWTRLTGQCQLLGSGMAFPWGLLQRFNLGSGHLVEDLKLTADMAKVGVGVGFLPSVQVDSCFPTLDSSRLVQSRRWEHGHLGMILTEVPRLLWCFLTTRRLHALALALDMLVPPLSLLVVVLCLFVSTGWALALVSGEMRWFALGSTVLSFLAFSVLGFAWFRWARHIVSIRDIALIPAFVAGKLKIYTGFVSGREKTWRRSDRN